MAKRLGDLFRPGDQVEILLLHGEERFWEPAQVMAHDFPGIWVETRDGHRWFVTNRRRIRRLPGDAGASPRGNT